MALALHARLLSDATPGQGEGVAGLVDMEVVYDRDSGTPYLRGRSLKGLLVEECANLLWSLREMGSPRYVTMRAVAARLFGTPGSTTADTGLLTVESAVLPPEVTMTLRTLRAAEVIGADEILDAFTAIRRQTAIDAETGAPQRETLRASRVLRRGLEFVAPLTVAERLTTDEEALLAACVAAVRRLGTARTRGRGSVLLWLDDPERSDLMNEWLGRFADAVGGPRECQ